MSYDAKCKIGGGDIIGSANAVIRNSDQSDTFFVWEAQCFRDILTYHIIAQTTSYIVVFVSTL